MGTMRVLQPRRHRLRAREKRERAQANGCLAREPVRTARPVRPVGRSARRHRSRRRSRLTDRGGAWMTLADDTVRDEIRDNLAENLFVDAGAGTGKTSALVDRVVASVLRDG